MVYKDNTYIIAGAGDSSVRDLDIIVYDHNFNKLRKDIKTNSTLKKFLTQELFR